MAVNVKMGVDLGSFTSGIKEGQQILKGLNAEMKASEAEFKATGNAEQKLTSQTKTLNSQIQVQKGIADQARQALDKMTKAGVDPADAAYQKLYVTMMNAEAGANEAQAALNQLGEGAAQAATGADKMASSLNGISKKISLDQVISGINTITSGLENAAKRAFELGEQIWNAMMDKARWADDTATMAQMYGIDVDTFQRMQKLVTNGLDTTVDAMLRSQQKLNKGVGEQSKGVMDTLEKLGLALRSGKDDMAHLITTDQTELFWKAGQAIMGMADAAEQEAAAQDIFGRSWHELVPLFTQYKTVEEYNKALEDTYVVSEEGVTALAELNDKYNELKGNFDTLSTEIMATLAPALTEAANTLNGLLENLLEYLQTEEGKEMLKQMGDSVSQLFEGMKNINAEDVVNAFKEGFDKVTDALQWVVDNKDTVITAIEAIFGFWATLKVSSGVLTILKVINGLKDLAGIGAAGAGAGAIATGTGTLLSKTVTGIGNLLGNNVLMNNAPAVGDWFVHNTGIGQEYILGTKEKGSTVEEIKHNVETWADQDNPIFNFFRDMGENSIRFWDKFWKGNSPQYTPETIEEADWRPSYMKDQQPVPIETVPEAPADAAEQLAEQVGEVTVPLQFAVDPNYANYVQYADKMSGQHANGLAYVPYDGYLARLHKGERVVPAREVGSRSYNSNLYVESMYMNGGTDAAGLASAMAAAQRRQMSGYGS